MKIKTPISKPKRIFLYVAGFMLVIAIAGLVALPGIKRQWSTPLGPALELPTYTPTNPLSTATQALLAAIAQTSPTSSILDTPSAESSTVPVSPPTPTIQPTSTPAPLCGGPPVMLVLGVGVDTEDDTYRYGLGDAIRIARIDFVTPKVTVLSLPRDLWVEIPDISEHYGITHGKLNQSYFYGSPGMGYYTGPGAGPGLMARTLDLNFGLRVDHYGAVNMSTFSRIVDAVGGIDVYLPTDVDGSPIDERTADMGYFDSGMNHFNGDAALRFSRIRKRYNDFTRMDHQNMVLCALKKKLLTPSVLPRIPKIIAAFQNSVITDLSLEQMSQMACLLPFLKRENLILTGLPQEIMSPSRVMSPEMSNTTFVMDVDFNVIRDYVSQFLAGTWPVEGGEGSTCD
jgi:LCP family protein required for cell wall assembly